MIEEREDWSPLYSAAGVPVGSFRMGRGWRHKTLSKKDREYCAEVVRLMSERGKVERMAKEGGSKDEVFTSQIFVGGTVMKTGGTWCLVNVGEMSQYIFCAPDKADKALGDRMKKYQEGDHILTRGWLKISSYKDEESGQWMTRAVAVVTEIRSDDPKHEERRAAAQQQFEGGDDDIPF